MTCLWPHYQSAYHTGLKEPACVFVSPWNLVASGGQRCWGLTHIYIFNSSTWLHVHYKGTERTKSCHVRKCSNLQTSWGGYCDKKKYPLSPSILNSCHISNFLKWSIKTPHKAVPHCAMWSTKKENTVCIYPDLVATKSSWKTNILWNTRRETLF